jgi:hypothetical protein
MVLPSSTDEMRDMALPEEQNAEAFTRQDLDFWYEMAQAQMEIPTVDAALPCTACAGCARCG